MFWVKGKRRNHGKRKSKNHSYSTLPKGDLSLCLVQRAPPPPTTTRKIRTTESNDKDSPLFETEDLPIQFTFTSQ